MTHDRFMQLALREAMRAFEEKEVPVGAVAVLDGVVIGKGYNQVERLNDATAHAEMIALTAAAAHLGQRQLDHVTLYVTLEPCPMCAGAIVNSRIPQLVFGAYDPKAGACGTLFTITNDARLNHRVETLGGIMEEQCGAILKEFFAMRRA